MLSSTRIRVCVARRVLSGTVETAPYESDPINHDSRPTQAGSIWIKSVPATLKSFGNTGLTGFRVKTKLRLWVDLPLFEVKMFPSKAPYSLASSSCVRYELLFAAPIVLPRSKRQHPKRTGRRTKIVHRGRIMEAPVFSQHHDPMDLPWN